MKRNDKRLSVHRRAGTYLLEMLVVIGVASMLMGVITLTLHQVMLSNTQQRDRASDTLAQQRLARLFREDCEAAVAGEMVAKQLILKMADGRQVTYEPDENVVIRTWTDSGSTGSDRFYSTRQWTCDIVIEEPSIGRLTVGQAFGGSERTLPGTPRQLVVDAQIGRLQSLVGGLDLETPANSEQEDKQ